MTVQEALERRERLQFLVDVTYDTIAERMKKVEEDWKVIKDSYEEIRVLDAFIQLKNKEGRYYDI